MLEVLDFAIIQGMQVCGLALLIVFIVAAIVGIFSDLFGGDADVFMGYDDDDQPEYVKEREMWS